MSRDVGLFLEDIITNYIGPLEVAAQDLLSRSSSI
jgi:hypothetical protein